MVSCQDVSSNGTYLNGSSIHKSSVLVMDGDVIEIGTRSSSPSYVSFTRYSRSPEFECKHTMKNPEQKLHVFDPTPPPDAAFRSKVTTDIGEL